ncbi:Serine protease Do-like HtrA [Lacunisphaera limnophila]|uniref:Serine protease Do-like HtrA n=1 Tax=Lacunisphaera limnophila TaxID=1838286 RepID=A0A1D8AVY2_9BACT|nr:PDZ domain-containing protein [Lacunisphaera limnophila]AOS45043.1 Serine protease Do-like HtrA [Lacunisphaera limnophila]
MKNPIVIRLVPLLLLAVTAFAETEAKKEIVIRRGPPVHGGGQQLNINMDRRGPGPLEMEKVAYLGVETMPVDPTMAAQLGLPRGTGLVVRRVAEGSPAAGLLQEHDILTKLDDQILVNMPQLSVLVRSHQSGNEVKLTYVRAGKEATATAKLGEREVPKLSSAGAMGAPGLQFFGQNGPMGGGHGMAFSHAMPAMPMAPGQPGAMAMPAMPANEAGDVMRVIGGDRMHWFGQPRVHVLRRQGGMGSTILDLPSGNFVFSDDDGSVEVNASEGKRELTVKDPAGKVTFQGPIGSPEEHAKLPPEVRTRIDAIGGAELDGEAGEIRIETKVLEPASKIRFELPPSGDAANEEDASLRTL